MVLNQLLVPVGTILKDSHDIVGLTESSLAIVGFAVNGCEDDTNISGNHHSVMDVLLSNLYPLIVARVLKTEDSAIIPQSTSTITAFINKAPAKISIV